MRFRSPSLAELHAFAAVARLGSFSAAAQALSVTQGAVSRAVQRLEAGLGVALLARGGARVMPTPDGANYLARIGPALEMLESAVPLTASAPGPSLCIAPVPSLYARWLVPRLPALQALHPRLSLAFRRWHHDDRFERDDVDCWINPKPNAHSRWPEGIVAQYLLGRELVPGCAGRPAPRSSPGRRMCCSTRCCITAPIPATGRCGSRPGACERPRLGWPRALTWLPR